MSATAPPPQSPAPHFLSGVLDELDVGVLVVDGESQLRHANRRAWQELTADHPLQLLTGRLRARDAADVAPLQQAQQAALRQGRRHLLTLDREGSPVAVAVLPLAEQRGLVMLLLGRRHLGDRCMLQWFASQHGLTPSEQRVLEGLADGQAPHEIATELRIGIATVRTHIGSLRGKVGAPSIRALLHRMAGLPPMAQRLPN